MTEPYSGQERRANPPAGWHLKKEIQLGHVITTITLAVSAIVYIQKIEQRIALAEAQIEQLHTRDAATTTELREAMQHVRIQYDKLDAKLDRLIERGTR